MKKFIYILSIIILAFNANAQTVIKEAEEDNLLDDKIYFFAHSMCHTCKDTYVFFATQYKELDIPIVDISSKHNLELYKQCVKKFNIKNSELTLPLICMGNHYIMGWTSNDENFFAEYVKEFKN